MAAKRQFVSDVEMQKPLSKLKTKNEDEIQLISELSSQCDEKVKYIEGSSTPDNIVVEMSIPEVEISNNSNLVINSYLWEQAGDATGFHPYSHKLIWDGMKYKTVSIYYKFNNTNSYGWNQVDHWEYMQLNYGDSEVLEAEIHFPARTRSNDISSEFLTSETETGGNGYWSLKMDHNQDNTFYYVSHIRTDEPDPYTGTHDHIKIFLHNTYMERH